MAERESGKPLDATTGPPGEITELLRAVRAGDTDAAQRLFAIVYGDLRVLARRQVRAAGGGHGATSLVHETFLRFVRRGELPYNDRVHFFAVASRAMRQTAIDDARTRTASKRGGGKIPRVVVERFLSTSILSRQSRWFPVGDPEDVMTVDAAVMQLANEHPDLAQVVEWHFFGG